MKVLTVMCVLLVNILSMCGGLGGLLLRWWPHLAMWMGHLIIRGPPHGMYK